jgi:hypothetical protein
MIVYDYDPDDFFFCGPIEAQLDPFDGTVMVPGHATLIEPPKIFDAGKIQVFNKTTQSWQIVEDNFWRPKFKIIKHEWTGDITVFPKLRPLNPLRPRGFLGIPRLLNPQLFYMVQCERINSIINRINSITDFHKFICSQQVVNMSLWIEYKTEIESIIHLMTKTIDDIITINYVQLYRKEVIEEHKLVIDGIGDLRKKLNGELISRQQAVKNAINYQKYEDFLLQIQEINNSFKHDIIQSEIAHEFNFSRPTIFALAADRRSLNEITFHEFDLGQLSADFDEFINNMLG